MRYCAVLVFIFCVNILSAQEKHFVYIQSDNKQLFYLEANGRRFSSTANGYAIIPKLEKGVYNLMIGFADTAVPEQNFRFEIDRNDLGFNLKNFGEKGWGLFNLQTLNVQMAGAPIQGNVVVKAAPELVKKDLEQISFEKKRETVVVEKVVPIPPNPDTATVVSVGKKVDTAAAENSNPPAVSQTVPAPNTQAPVATAAKADSQGTSKAINKVAEQADSDGLHLSFADKSSKTPDTIYVVIPASSSKANGGDTVKVPASEITLKKSGSEPVFSCTPASEEDFRKLRKKMASVATDEKMIGIATKFYRERCFTTAQIRLLSTLFLSDEGRYRFFDSSYPYAADPSNYNMLEKEFIDNYYLNRFKAMLR